MQDMFLSKFKKLKQKNKVLFNKALKSSGLNSPENTDESKKADDETKSTG